MNLKDCKFGQYTVDRHDFEGCGWPGLQYQQLIFHVSIQLSSLTNYERFGSY
jgi:hypothetical protein